MTHIKRHWKKYAILAVGAGALAYGVDPDIATAALVNLLAVFGL